MQEKRSARICVKQLNEKDLKLLSSLPIKEARWRDNIAARRLSDSEYAPFDEAYNDRRYRPTLPSNYYRTG